MNEKKAHVGRPTNKEVKERKSKKISKIILTVIATIFSLIILVYIGSAIYTNCITVKLGKVADIKEDKIKITILSSEKIKIEEGDLSIANGEYIKVKLTIENYGKTRFDIDPLSFDLGGQIMDFKTLGLSDFINTEIEAGQKSTGYIYFPVTNSVILKYFSNMKVKDSNSISVSKTYFKIK